MNMSSEQRAPAPPGPGGRRRLSAVDRRAQIIAAAQAEFIENGVEGGRVKSIAQRAGISEVFLYRLFHSKEEIFELAVRQPLVEFVEGLKAETEELSQNPDISREHVLTHFHELFLDYVIDIAPLLSTALFSKSYGSHEMYTNFLLPSLREIVRSVIIDASRWSPTSEELDAVTQGLLGVYFGIALESLLGEDPIDVPHVAQQLTLIIGTGSSDPSKPAASPAPPAQELEPEPQRESAVAPPRPRVTPPAPAPVEFSHVVQFSHESV